MKIAVSGAHRTGKSTLIDELASSLTAFRAVDEPYYALQDEGHVFEALPSVDDFELQLERAIESVLGSDPNRIFDRCPLDVLAYLTTHDESYRFEPDAWLPRVREAVQRLDLVIFVPIEDPDRVHVSESDHPRSRRRVDEELRHLLFNDLWSLDASVLEVRGSPGNRARQVLAYVERMRGYR